jgi:hypothetical protein
MTVRARDLENVVELARLAAARRRNEDRLQ